jgi:hypothetical protein
LGKFDIRVDLAYNRAVLAIGAFVITGFTPKNKGFSSEFCLPAFFNAILHPNGADR